MNMVDGPGSSSGGSDAGTDAAIPPGWDMLVSRSWSVTNPGDDKFFCIRTKFAEDKWISGFRALAPVGTHHSVLTIDPVTTETGNFDCDGSVGMDGRLLYASGLQTNDLTFPPGIAVHIPANTYVTLNLHVLNSSDLSLHDTSGVLVQTVDPSTVEHEVDATFAGTRTIDFPSNGMDIPIYGHCLAPSTWHVFALWPHMHEFGTHARLITTDTNNVSRTLLDQPFDFTQEKTYVMNETVMQQDDQITVQCTYNAGLHQCSYPNGACVPGTCESDGYCHQVYGESANGEMCYVALYKYPAGDVPAYGCHN